MLKKGIYFTFVLICEHYSGEPMLTEHYVLSHNEIIIPLKYMFKEECDYQASTNLF